jgi:hypothetical protein
MKTLEVISVEHKTSPKVAEKTGTEGRYSVITVATPDSIIGKDQMGNTRKMKVPRKVSAFVAWTDSPIPGRNEPDYGHDLNVGDVIPGDIVSRKVEKYFIASSNGDTQNEEGILGRWVTTASVVVPGAITEDAEGFEMAMLQAFKQRNFIIQGYGDAGQPGGSRESAEHRERTKMEGHSVRANMPLDMQNADAGDIISYSDQSSTKNQDQGSTLG